VLQVKSFRSGTVTRQVQAADGSTEIVVVQVNVVPVTRQDDMQIVAGAAIGTVNPYPITMNNREIASTLREMADAIEAQG
jgi:hypothetical protein